MKKLISLIVILLVSYTVNAQIEPLDTDSNGYRNISTLDHLRWVSENDSSWSWYFELDNNINAKDTRNWNEGKGFLPIGKNDDNSFTGIFDGKGNIIDSLFINRPNQDFIGLFGVIQLNLNEISNISIINCNITGSNYVGALIGFLSFSGVVSNTHSTGNVFGRSFTGGLIGSFDGPLSKVLNCTSSCNVQGTDYSIGGLIGFVNKGTISYCNSTGNISGKAEIGGFIGTSIISNITNNYSMANVISKDGQVGGLIGYNRKGFIVNCYSMGKVSSDSNNVGGLTGKDDASYRTKNSFWDIQTSGQTESASGEGKRTEEMNTITTYIGAGWNFNCFWKIDSSYPYIDFDMSIRPTDTDNNGSLNIKTFSNLLWLSESGYDLNKDWELDNDIDASETKNWINGQGFSPIGDEYYNHFTGKFDGNSHTIKNLYINRPRQDYIGLFAYVGFYTIGIQNIHIKDCNIIGGSRVGALVGYNSNKVIINCSSQGNIEGHSSVGGLVGENDGKIAMCYSTANIKGVLSKETGYAYDAFGGLVGRNNGKIADSYARGSVKGNQLIASLGGLVGIHGCSSESSAKISNCYATGYVMEVQYYYGGLVAQKFNENIFNSFWDIQTSGIDSLNFGNGKSTGKSTAEMKRKSTFIDSGWNFTEKWGMNSQKNDGYPYLLITPVNIKEQIEQQTFSLSPNPIFAGGKLKINFFNPILTYSVKIYNLKGMLIASYQNTSNIYISNLYIPSTYFIVIERHGKIIGTQKFIVK